VWTTLVSFSLAIAEPAAYRGDRLDPRRHVRRPAESVQTGGFQFRTPNSQLEGQPQDETLTHIAGQVGRLGDEWPRAADQRVDPVCEPPDVGSRVERNLSAPIEF
jgi:hypothetical protein